MVVVVLLLARDAAIAVAALRAREDANVTAANVVFICHTVTSDCESSM
jgi:hypothetical protein